MAHSRPEPLRRGHIGLTHLHDSIPARNFQLLVDFILDGYAVSVPAESPANMVPFHGPISGDNILDGGGEQVSIVGKALIESVKESSEGELG